MAICNYCRHEMTERIACTAVEYSDFPDGITRVRIPFGNDAENCHDCGTPAGGMHHPGCDDERCPLCNGQAISCTCNDDEES